MKRLVSKLRSPGKHSLVLGYRFYSARRFNEAEQHFRESLDHRIDVLGHDNVETLDSVFWVACSLVMQKNYKEAETYSRLAVLGQEHVLGHDHEDTLLSKYLLAHTLHGQDKHKDAEMYCRQVVLAQERIFGKDDEKTLDCTYFLATILYGQKRYEEAETYYRQAALGGEKVLGQDHKKTIISKVWLAKSLHEQGKHQEAEVYYRQAVSGWERLSGPDNEIILNTKHWLANAIVHQKRYEQAEICYRQVASGYEKVLGGNHETTLKAWKLVAHSLYDQRRYAEALTYYQQVALRYEEVLGPDHRTTLDIWTWKQLCQAQVDLGVENSISQDEQDSVVIAHVSGVVSAIELPRPESSENLTQTVGAEFPVQELAQQLDEFFIETGFERPAYSDSDITTISQLLVHLNLQWSKTPRLYVVLRTISCLHLLNNFIAAGFTDYWFPATTGSLPAVLDSGQRSDFVNAQHLVLTRALDLEKGAEGQHCYFSGDDALPLQKQRILGRGGFGQVDEVLSLISYQRYARKRVLRKAVLRGRKPEHLKLFITEIETLKRLQHKHIVQFVGSYSDTKYLGLLMRPVAEMDLSTYLSRPDISNRLGELRTFYGCLATALDFLHTQSVRHKDIKPENILIDHGNILFTDFGLSHDFADAQASTTVSIVNGMTARYCAPEVALCEPRNKSSDIWSLGIVYLEMLVILKGLTLEHMEKYFAEHGTQQLYVRTNREAFIEYLDSLKKLGNRGDNRVTEWISDMLRENPVIRPHTSLLMAIIKNPPKNERQDKAFCGICCISHDENDESSDFSD